MNNGLRFSLAFFLGLPALAGEGTLSSAKSGLEPHPAGAAFTERLIPTVTGVGSRWTLAAGVSFRRIGQVNFETGASRFHVPGVFGASSFTPPPGIGPENGLVARVYDDGFVRPGPRTTATGRTTDYEYKNQDQVQAGYLLLSAGGGERRVVTTSASTFDTGWIDEAGWQGSPSLSLSRITPLGKGWSAGPSLHFSFTSLGGSRNGLGTLSASEQRQVFHVRAFDRFDTTGLVLPQAPYTGSPGAVAPLLPVEPVNGGRSFENTLLTVDRALFQDRIGESLDLDLFGFSFGADAYFEDVDGFFVGLGTGLVLNVADWDARRTDRLFQSINGGAPLVIDAARFRDTGTDVLFGAYLQTAVGCPINEAVSLQANIRYDWNESLRDSVGDSDFEVNLSGFSLGLSVNYTF